MMKNYARIQDGLVAEIILSFATTEEGRPVAPIIDEGAEPTDAQVEQKRLHDAFAPGEVPIEHRFVPDIVAALVVIPDGAAVAQGDSYVDGIFKPPPAVVVSPVTVDQARAQRDALLAEATLRIDPLADAVELDDATADEVASLKAWRQYRVALNRIEQQTGFPAAVDWPKALA